MPPPMAMKSERPPTQWPIAWISSCPVKGMAIKQLEDCELTREERRGYESRLREMRSAGFLAEARRSVDTSLT